MNANEHEKKQADGDEIAIRSKDSSFIVFYRKFCHLYSHESLFPILHTDDDIAAEPCQQYRLSVIL